MIKYRKKKTIVNNEVTVALGEAEAFYNIPKSISKYISDHTSEWGYDNFYIHSCTGRGIARPNHDDDFNPVIGETVAAKKAELDSKKKLRNRMIKIHDRLLQVCDMLDKDIDDLSLDINMLAGELEDF